MPKGIIGRKVGMTQVFVEGGKLVPVTVVEAGPCKVVRCKTADQKEGYSALVVGFEDVRSAEVDGETVYKTNKPNQGVYTKAGIDVPKRVLHELRLDPEDVEKYKVGDEVTVDIFHAGEKVDVTGTSKGRGFAGVMKRHNMAGFKASHGTHEYFRHGGSIGMSATPARVHKGRRMPGQHGNKRVTVQNVSIVEVHPDTGLVLIQGAVPGANGSLVEIRDAVKFRRKVQFGL